MDAELDFAARRWDDPDEWIWPGAVTGCQLYDVPRALLLFARLRGLFARPRFEISDL